MDSTFGIIQIFFFLLCIALGRWQAWWFDIRQKTISHWIWATGYGLALVPVYLATKNIILVAICGAFHLPVFNTALNLSRKVRRSIFYTHPGDKNGSLLDTLWGKSYPVIFFLSIALIIFLEIFLFHNQVHS
jgi:hypothetical protein